jgi:hypothetical protein
VFVLKRWCTSASADSTSGSVRSGKRVAGEAHDVAALFRVIGEGQRLNGALELFPDDVQLALESDAGAGARQARIAADEHLPDRRLDGDRARPDVSIVGRHVAPAEQLLAFLGDEAFHQLLDGGALIRCARQEHEADAVLPFGREREGCHLAEESIRNLEQDACAVPRVGLAAARAAVPQVHQHLQRLLHDRVGTAPLDVHDEADSAGVVLVPGIIEAGRLGWLCDERHERTFIADLDSEGKYNFHIRRMTIRNEWAAPPEPPSPNH